MSANVKTRNTAAKTVIYIFLILLCAICMVPFLTMLSTSFSYVKGTLPEKPILFPDFPLYTENYVTIWEKQDFAHYFLNTVIVSGVGLCFNMVITVITAYAFAKFEFPGKNFIFNVMLVTMMIPAMLAIISQYTIINALGAVNTYWGVWLLWSGSCVAGGTFFFRGFFEGIPHELEESMMMDGANRWTILLRCIVPLAAPAIGTHAIFTFNGYWSDLFTVLTLIKNVKMRTLSVSLALYRSQHTTEYGLMFAASVIAMLPVVLVFVVFQKKFLKQGLTVGAVKG